jgi:hypothetical protein
MNPIIQIVSKTSAEKHDSSDWAVGRDYGVDVDVEVDAEGGLGDYDFRVRFECKTWEDEPEVYPGADVLDIGMKFTKHSWNAFKAFVDSHIAEHWQ